MKRKPELWSKLAVYVSVLRRVNRKTTTRKTEKRQRWAKCCKQNQVNTRLFRRIIRVYSTADVFLHFTIFSKEKFSFQEQKYTLSLRRCKKISLQDFPRKALPWPWSGDRQILPAPGTNQIAGFSGYRPLTIKEMNKTCYFHECDIFQEEGVCSIFLWSPNTLISKYSLTTTTFNAFSAKPNQSYWYWSYFCV